MPRDCTAPGLTLLSMYSPLHLGIQYKVKFFPMIKNKQKKRGSSLNPKKKNNNNAKPQQVIVYRDVPAPPAQRNSGLGDVGLSVGNFVSKIFGLGAYQINRNSVWSDITRNQVPVMHSSSESVKFRHREYVCDINSSVGFTSRRFPVNPGLDQSFPYLARIAQNFQEYKFNGLVYEFKSTSADALNSTNTALGTIMMSAQYRADAAAFIDKQGMLNEMWSCDTKPSESILLPIECNPKENPLGIQYVRGNNLPAGQDVKLFDLATFTIAAVGSQQASVVGELWATYEVELFKPQYGPAVLTYADSARYRLPAVTTTAPLGGTFPTSDYDNMGITFSLLATDFFLPSGSAGSYEIFYQVVGGSAAVTGPSISLTNASLSNTWPGSATSINTPAGTTTTTFILCFVINVTDSTLPVRVLLGTGGTLPAPAASGVLVINQIANPPGAW